MIILAFIGGVIVGAAAVIALDWLLHFAFQLGDMAEAASTGADDAWLARVAAGALENHAASSELEGSARS